MAPSRPESITTYLIAKAASVSDLLEVNVLLKEAGLWRPGDPPYAAIMAVPLFETIGDLEQAPAVMSEWLGLPEVSVPAGLGADGMPALNLSVVGLPGDDARVLMLAHAYERHSRRFGAPPR